MVKIYTIEDPITKEVVYVGKTKNTLKSRLNGHISASKRHKFKFANYINSIITMGYTPVISLIDEVDDNNWQFWEQFYICLFKSWGYELKNITLGGDLDNTGKKLSDETKKRMSKPKTKEHIEKVRLSNIGKKRSKDVIDKMKMFKHSDASNLMNSISHLGKVTSDETKKKQSDALIGIKKSRESVEKMLETRRINRLSKTKLLKIY